MCTIPVAPGTSESKILTILALYRGLIHRGRLYRGII